MKKMFGLTYNEVIKMYKKSSTKVIIAIIVIAAAIIPMGTSFFMNREDNTSLDYYKDTLKRIEKNINDYESSDDIDTILPKVLAKADKEKLHLIIDNNIEEQWKLAELDRLYEVIVKILSIEEIQKGIEREAFSNDTSFLGQVLEGYTSLSEEDLKKELEELKSKRSEMEKNILENNYEPFLEMQKAEKKNAMDLLGESIKGLEEELKENPNNKELKERLDYDKESLKGEEASLDILEYRINNRVSFDKDDWKNITLIDIEKKKQELDAPLLDKKAFEEKHIKEIGYGLTYEDYKKNYEILRKELIKDIELSWHSLENNTQRIEVVDDARSIIDGSYDVIMILVILLAIILAGGIVASEYSSGTIRLLVIRPVARFKILLSKLLAVLSISYTTLILSVIVLTVSSGVTFGFGTVGINVLVYAGEVIVAKSFMIYLISNMLFSSISLIFIISLVFMLSTLAKNTAVSVSIGMLVFLWSGTMASGLAILKMRWVGMTILPYVNLSTFNLNPTYAKGMAEQFGIHLQPGLGAIQLLIFAVIFVAIAFGVFIKKDIRN